MIILALCALFSGYLLVDIFTGPMGLLFWRGSIAVPMTALTVEHEFGLFSVKLLPTIAGFIGTILGLIYYSSCTFYSTYLAGYFGINLMTQKFYFDQLYILTFARFSVNFGYTQYKLLDRGILEFFGPSGLTHFIRNRLSQYVVLHTDYLLHYLLFIISSIILFLIFVLYTKDTKDFFTCIQLGIILFLLPLFIKK